MPSTIVAEWLSEESRVDSSDTSQARPVVYGVISKGYSAACYSNRNKRMVAENCCAPVGPIYMAFSALPRKPIYKYYLLLLGLR